MGGDEAGGLVAEEGGGALTPEAWQLAFRRGLGRALQRVNEIDPEVVRPVLLDGCLNDRAYDAQIEGVRARWMAEFLRRSALGPGLVPDIVARLGDPTESHWDAELRLEVLAHLVKAGHGELAEVLRATFPMLFRRQPHHTSPAALLLIDGVDALLPFARLEGEWLESDPEAWVDHGCFAEFRDVLSEEVLCATLSQAATTDGRIAAVVRALDESRSRPPGEPTPPRPVTARELEAALRGGKEPWRLIYVGRRLDDVQMHDIIARILIEGDPVVLQRLLMLCRGHWSSFGRRKPQWKPLDMPQSIRELAHDGRDEVRVVAMEVLESADDPLCAELAREVLREGPSRARVAALGLLGRHCAPDDVPRVLDTLRELPADAMGFDELHSDVIMPLRRMTEGSAGLSLAEALAWAYEHAPCGCCRRFAVERLSTWSALTEARRAECLDDSCDDVRAAAGW